MNATTTEKKSKSNGLLWLWVSWLIVVIDQVTKYFALENLEFDQPVILLPFLNFTLEQNRGAAFSFLSHAGFLATFAFISTAIIVSIIICIWLYRINFKNYWLGMSLSLILGGAIGNLIDRISYGYVVDFIHFHLRNWNFAIFNIADSAISIGAALLIFDVFRKKKQKNEDPVS